MTTTCFACDPTLAADFLHAYQNGMRPQLFTGFLTLCGFLMTAKTFIVTNMKKEVYEKKLYLLNFDSQRRLERSLKVYEPLERLSKWLLVNVLASLVTPALQFTVGFIPHWVAACVCLAAAIVTVALLGLSLYHIRFNLKQMFHWLGLEAEEKIKEALEEQAKKKAEYEAALDAQPPRPGPPGPDPEANPTAKKPKGK